MGEINCEEYMIKTISLILELGTKFVPDLFDDKNNFLIFFIKQLDSNFFNFNSNFIFLKNRLEAEKNRDTVITDNNEEDLLNDHSIDFVMEDSFFLDLKSKINKKNKKITVNKNISKFNIDSSVMDFRSSLQTKLLEDLKNFKSEINFSKCQIRIVKKYLHKKPFKILNCDKNVGWAIIQNDNYLELAFKFLKDDQSYKELENNPLDITIRKINFILNRLFVNAHISLEIRDTLLLETNKYKLGNFKLMAKVHKKEFGWRPIINSIDHPTSKICFLLDKIFQPFVLKTDSYIKDSQNLIQICQKVKFKNPPYIYSLDFSSLYSNIDPVHAVPTLTDFLSSRINSKHMNITAINTFLKIIFDHNVFKFEDKFFVQNKGLAMGCICGPSFANLYLHILEKKWLVINHPLIYSRFIDDIFMALEKELDLDEFTKTFVYLKLTSTSGKEIVFLDTVISYDRILDTLKFDLYVKPTNNGSYLLPTSIHPTHIFENIPANLMIRIRRICTNYSDFCHHIAQLILHLLKRGYDKQKLRLYFSRVSNLDRLALIPYKDKKIQSKFFAKNSIFIQRIFAKNLENMDNLIYESFNSTINKAGLYKLNIVNKINLNLGAIFVNGFSNTLPLGNKTTACEGCTICRYLHIKPNFLIGKWNLKLSFLDNGNCNSTHLIYIIFCSKCSKFYVGETGKSLKERMKQHINHIKKFIPYRKYHEFILAKHFNLKGHTMENFSCCIFKSNIYDIVMRKSMEKDLIRFLNLGFTDCLNEDVSLKITSLIFGET